MFGYSLLGLFMYPKQRTKTSMTNGNKNLCVENRGICHILANNSSQFEKSKTIQVPELSSYTVGLVSMLSSNVTFDVDLILGAPTGYFWGWGRVQH